MLGYYNTLEGSKKKVDLENGFWFDEIRGRTRCRKKENGILSVKTRERLEKKAKKI